MTRYEENRARFSAADLQPYEGQWVAFSLDGSRILASAETLAALEVRLVEAAADPQKVALERIALLPENWHHSRHRLYPRWQHRGAIIPRVSVPLTTRSAKATAATDVGTMMRGK